MSVIIKPEMGEELDADEVQAVAKMLNLSNAFIDTFVLKCAIQLRLPEIIRDLSKQCQNGPTLSQITQSFPHTSVNLDHLFRILAYMVNMDLLTIDKDEDKEERYNLTGACHFLLHTDTNGGKNMKNFVAPITLFTNPGIMSPWHSLDMAIVVPSSVVEATQGATFWELMARQSQLNDTFMEFMAADTRLLMPTVMRILREEGSALGKASSFVDVGGGIGAATSYIAAAFPHVKCSVLDLSHVIKTATLGVDSPLELVEGDMFKHVPNADVVLLKRVLHDWKDEECVKILERCKEAIPRENGVVIIIEVVMNEKEDDIFHRWKLALDMAMMVLLGGKERNRDEWSSLLHKSGFNAHKITPALLGYSVIEARPF